MDEKIIKLLHQKLTAAQKEIQILYEMSEAEMLVMQSLMMCIPFSPLSPELASKCFRAIAHLIESTAEIGKEVLGDKK